MVTCLNMSPSINGISNNPIPVAIFLVSTKHYSNKLRITFGDYAQLYIGTNNNTKKITVRAIALQLLDKRGGYYFMSFATGRQLLFDK